ncbi:unnamed protein product [Rotaria socialis]
MTKRGFLSENEYKQATPGGSLCVRLYGLPKVHKIGIPLRPIISSIGSYNYRLVKLLAAKLQPLRKNKYILKDTFDFVESIKKLNRTSLKYRMVSFHVTGLFTKVPLSYTINLILDKMYEPEHICPKFIKVKSDWYSKCLDRNYMKTLLDIATFDTHFSFNNLYYQQHNGVTMRSPLAPVLSDIFMIHLENKLIDKLKKAGVLWYKKYVDDTFVIIRKAKINNIKKILNSVHKDIKFTSVQEQSNELLFLDVLVRRNNKMLETSVYRKPTYTSLLLKWPSFVPKRYEISAISCMVYRAIHISSSFTIMHKEFDFIQDITKLNGYPKNFVECQIRHTLNRYIAKQNMLNTDNETKQSEQKHDNKETHIDRIVFNVPYAEKATRQFSKEINKLAKKKEHGAPQNITTTEPNQNLRRSERIAKSKRLQIYYGESDNNTDEEEVPQITTTSAIQQHIASTKHKIDWNNWLILDNDNHSYGLLVKGSLAITENSPSLNRTTRSIPLLVYPEGIRKRSIQNKTTSQDSK